LIQYIDTINGLIERLRHPGYAAKVELLPLPFAPSMRTGVVTINDNTTPQFGFGVMPPDYVTTNNENKQQHQKSAKGSEQSYTITPNATRATGHCKCHLFALCLRVVFSAKSRGSLVSNLPRNAQPRCVCTGQ
jgi:hypothetical protein